MQHHAAPWLQSNLQSLLQCSEPLAFMSILRINFASPQDLEAGGGENDKKDN